MCFMKYVLNEMAKKLAEARRERGLTQVALAELLGVPQSYVARVESGKSDLRTSRLIEISRLLGYEVLLVPRKDMHTVEWALEDESEKYDFETDNRAYKPDEWEDDDE